jgi:DNA processing protein
MSDVRYYLGFNLVPHIGPARQRALQNHFGDLEAAWRASATSLRACGLPQNAIDELQYRRLRLDLDAELARVEAGGYSLLTWECDSYPPLLRAIDLPPPLLYVDGAVTPEDELAVAIVGTRGASAYGKGMAERLSQGLAESGVTIVSGLALGIDGVAHRAALAAGGRTIAVLGSGVDVIYPDRHRGLAADIRTHGAVISDYPLGTTPEAGNFPPRNRIISGLSLGTVVVEAGARSGALITVHFALDQGRDTFAVPGNAMSATSAGTNRLIQQGEAKLVSGAQDVLEELNLTMVQEQRSVRQVLPTNDQEAAILRHLAHEPLHLDEVVRLCGLPTETVSSTLCMMELKGMVRRVENMSYVLGI